MCIVFSYDLQAYLTSLPMLWEYNKIWNSKERPVRTGRIAVRFPGAGMVQCESSQLGIVLERILEEEGRGEALVGGR
jgi:hypothetical protein